MWYILIAFMIIKPHIHFYAIQASFSPMKGPYRHWLSSRAGSFKSQSKYTEVFSNNAGLPTTTLLFIYVFIWISCILVEMLGAVCRAIWGPFDKGWLALAKQRCVALRLGYLSWGLIMMLLSWSLRRLCSLCCRPPFVGRWPGRFPPGAPTRNVALDLRMHSQGRDLGLLGVLVRVSMSLPNPGSVKYVCWVILLHLWFCPLHRKAGWVIIFCAVVHRTTFKPFVPFITNLAQAWEVHLKSSPISDDDISVTWYNYSIS